MSGSFVCAPQNMRIRRDTQDGVTPRSRKKMEENPSRSCRPTMPGYVAHESGWNTSTQLREVDYQDCKWWFSNTDASLASTKVSKVTSGTVVFSEC